jgi:hypothetical protein
MGRPSARVRWLAVSGALAIGCATAALVVMQLRPPAGLHDPLSTPLSNYALSGDSRLFDAAVLLLVVGVLGVGGALVVDGATSIGVLPSAGLTMCGVGLAAVAVFPFDATASGRLTTAGWVHVAASGLVFVGPPLAALSLARRHRPAAGCSRLPQFAGWLAAAAPGWLAVALLTAAFGPAGSMPAWRLGGVFERDLAAADIVTALVLAAWAYRGCSCRTTGKVG